MYKVTSKSDFHLSDLLNIEELDELLKKLHKVSGIPSSIIDLEGNILTGAGWQRICTDFHRKNEQSCKLCIESDLKLREEIQNGAPYAIYKCPMGLVDACMPLKIEGQHLANVFSGQVLTEKITKNIESKFRKQAKDFEFNEDEYIEALHEVPVFTQVHFKYILDYLVSFSETMSKEGLIRLRNKQQEKLLKDKTDQLELILESTELGTWDWDFESGNMVFDKRSYEMLGLTLDEDNQNLNSWKERIHPEDYELLVLAFADIMEHKIDSFEYEFRMKHANGSWIWISDKGKVVEFNKDNSPKKICGTILEITERKFHEIELRHTYQKAEKDEKRLRKYVENIPLGVFVINHDGYFLEGNRALCEITGYPLEELLAMHISKVFHPEFLDKGLSDFNDIKSKNSGSYSVEIITKRGKRRYLRLNAVALDKNQILGIAEDITVKLELESDYQNLFQEMHSGFAQHEIILDKKGEPVDYRFLKVNPAFERLTGLKAESIIGKTVLEVLPGTEKYWIERYGRVAINGESIQFTDYSSEIDKYYHVSAFQPVQNQFAAIFTDVTEARKAEKEIRDSEEKFRKIFEADVVGIALSNHDGTIPDVNDAFLDIIGYTRQDFEEGKIDWRKLTPEEHLQKDEKAIEELNEKGTTNPYEKEYIKKNGERTSILIGIKPLDSEIADVVGYIVCIDEIVEKRNELSKRNEFIETVINNLKIGLGVYDTQTDEVLLFNKACEDIVGVKFEEISTRAEYYKRVFTDDEYRKKLFKSTSKDLEQENNEISWHDVPFPYPSHPDVKYMDATNIPLPSQNMMIAMIQDVTERKNQELKNKEYVDNINERVKELRCLFNLSKTIMKLSSPGEVIVYLVNHIAEGWQYPDQTACLLAFDDVILQSDNYQETEWKLENDLVCNGQKRGTISIVYLEEFPEEDINPFPMEKKSLLEAISSMLTDFIMRKEAEKHLLEYKKVVESSSDLITIMDSELRYKIVNQTYLNYQRINREDLIGKHASEMIPDSIYENTIKPHFESCLKGEHVKFEIDIPFPEQGIRSIFAAFSPVVDSTGIVVGIAAIMRDFTERKVAEEKYLESIKLSEETAKLASVGVLAAGITHEINQPLNAIRLGSDGIAYWNEQNPGILPEFIESFVSSISEGSLRISKIIKHMKSFWIQKDQAEIESADINDSILKAVSLTRNQAISHNVNIQIDLLENPLLVDIIDIQFEQIIINLVVNAIHAHDMNCVDDKRVLIESGIEEGIIFIKVCDNAGGINEVNLESIFDPFYSSKDISKGMGLGLAIVKMFVDKFDGKILVYNNDIGGATFEVFFNSAGKKEDENITG